MRRRARLHKQACQLALAGADFDPEVVWSGGKFFEDAVLPCRIVEKVLAEFLAGHGKGSLANLR